MTLLEIQVELKAPKSQYNKFGGYKYRSTEDILQAVKPLLKKYGDSLDLSDEPVLIGDWHYIKATAAFKDKDGNNTVVTGYAREAANKKGMDDSQITGTASSYARKYALNGLFLIDDTKDADTDEYHQQQQSGKRQPSKNNAKATPAKNNAKAELAKVLGEYRALLPKAAEAFNTTTSEVEKQVKVTAEKEIKDYDKLPAIERGARMNGILKKMLEEQGASEQGDIFEEV